MRRKLLIQNITTTISRLILARYLEEFKKWYEERDRQALIGSPDSKPVGIVHGEPFLPFCEAAVEISQIKYPTLSKFRRWTRADATN